MSTVDNAQLDKMLSDAFAAASALYKERGFQRRVGWGKKPALVSVDLANKDLWAIDSRIAPIPGEYTLLKKRASSFHGTELAGILRANNVDTIVVTGVTACACVRQTICDGIADGFRTIAAREAIGDRVPGADAGNLFYIDATFGEVESVDTIGMKVAELAKA